MVIEEEGRAKRRRERVMVVRGISGRKKSSKWILGGNGVAARVTNCL